LHQDRNTRFVACLQTSGDQQGIAFLARPSLPGRGPQLQAGGPVQTDIHGPRKRTKLAAINLTAGRSSCHSGIILSVFSARD